MFSVGIKADGAYYCFHNSGESPSHASPSNVPKAGLPIKVRLMEPKCSLASVCKEVSVTFILVWQKSGTSVDNIIGMR